MFKFKLFKQKENSLDRNPQIPAPSILNIQKEDDEPITLNNVEDIIESYLEPRYPSKQDPPANAVKLVLRGTCIGDMIGEPFEGIGEPHWINPEDAILYPGVYTDDTVMTLAVFQAYLDIVNHSDWDYPEQIQRYTKTMREWAKKYKDAGYGANFYAWAVLDQTDERYVSYGDGGAMRAGIIGALAPTWEKAMEQAVLSAMPTHSHPHGIKGAVCAAGCVWLALNGYDKEEIRKFALSLYPDGFRTIEEFNQKDKTYMAPDLSEAEMKALSPKTSSVISQISVPLAVSIFLQTDSFESSIRQVLKVASDADTVAAISGSIAAAYYKQAELYDLSEDEFRRKTKELYQYFC